MTRPIHQFLLTCVLAGAAPVCTGALHAACPERNAVGTLSSSLTDFPNGIDFSVVAASAAREKSGGNSLYVYLSNTELSLGQMSSSMVSPIKDQSQGVLILKLSNGQEKVAPGEYSPAAGYGQPGFASAELRRMKPDGKAMDLVFNLKSGTIHLQEVANGRACGTFDLTGIEETRISGSFDVAIE
jgi:hypothetical protein